MKWKEVLFTILNEDKIATSEISELLTLPKLRDEVFYPDYIQYGYTNEEVVVHSTDTANTISLTILSANRRINLTYCFLPNVSPRDGYFLDVISLVNEEKKGIAVAYIDVLAEKRFKIQLPSRYNYLNSYKGSFTEKVIACIGVIKLNYDRYALDIISGDNWDNKAWKDYE